MLFLFLWFLLGRADDCQLRLILNDLGGDGWGDNSITGTANNAPIAFEPLTDSATVNTDGSATLESGAIGSFSFTVPSGSSLSLTFQGTAGDNCQHESWVVELFDIYNPFGAVILSQSAFGLKDSLVTPYAPPVASVVCGPTPDAVSGLTVTPTDRISTISWTRCAADKGDEHTAYSVFYTSGTSTDIHFLGVTFDNEFTAILPVGTLHVSVQSVNQYGPGPVVTQDVTIQPYSTGRLFLRCFSSFGNGWGGGNKNDGYVSVKLNDNTFYIAGFGCDQGSVCHQKDHILDIPSGTDWELSLDFTEPSEGASDCSFKLYRGDGVPLFDSGQDHTGPVTRSTKLDVHFDEGCPCADPWGDCVPTDGVCGDGKQTRNTYQSLSGTSCSVVPASQACSVPCPVDCQGNFSAYSACSPSCGVGHQTRTFTVTQQAQNNGKDCPYANGQTQTVQCTDNPPCPQQCSYRLTGYDSEGDGWDGGKVVVTGASGQVSLTIATKSDDDLNATKNSVDFQAQRGATVTFTWTAGADPKCDIEASFEVQLLVAGVVIRQDEVLQNPPGLNTSVAPTAVTSFVAQCADCSKAPKDLCDSLHRQQCEFSQVGDNTCGHCAPGYTSSTSLVSGTTACSDIDECSVGINPCQAQNAKCKNTDGGFICYCSDPTDPCEKQERCELTPQSALSFLETGVIAKQTPTALPAAAQTCPTIQTRKDWAAMTNQEKLNWVAGIQAAYNYLVNDLVTPGTVIPSNWVNDPTYGWITGSANNAAQQLKALSLWQWTRIEHMYVSVVTPVHNGDPRFLPWHRYFLKAVESAIQSVTPGLCVTIPYWDSSANRVANGMDPATQALLSDTTTGLCMMGDGSGANYLIQSDTNCTSLKNIPGCASWETSNPYCSASNGWASTLVRDFNWYPLLDEVSNPLQGVRSPTELFSIISEYTNWWYGGFCTDIEQAHIGVHTAVNGWMGQLPAASGDPLFFMHHCFIDMLWAGYQTCNGEITDLNTQNWLIWDDWTSGWWSEWTAAMPRTQYSPRDMYDPTGPNVGIKYDYNFFEQLNANSPSAVCHGDSSSSWWDTSVQAAQAFLQVKDDVQPIAGAPTTPYKPYKGFYCPLDKGADPNQRYCTHGAGRKKQAGKGKGKKKKAGDKPTKGDQKSDNLKKIHKAYQEDFEANKDHGTALEAMHRMECTLHQHTKKRHYTDLQVKGMMAQKGCAEGKCNDQCYQLLKGKNAKKHTKNYLAKHGGKYPTGYLDACKATEGATPPTLLEGLALFEKNHQRTNNHHNVRSAKQPQGSVLDPMRK